MKAEMDHLSDCVFIDKAAFHINRERTATWPRLDRAEVVYQRYEQKQQVHLGNLLN
jgi:hypothetical protein